MENNVNKKSKLDKGASNPRLRALRSTTQRSNLPITVITLGIIGRMEGGGGFESFFFEKNERY